jgi:ATP-dependent helicase/nuclease subunit B
VTISAALVAPPDALGALAAAIADAKGDDPLAAVTVAVPTNTCGVMTRRALARAGGVVGVDMVTLNRLAELIAGPGLAAAGRSPVSTPVIDLAIGAVLATDPGPFAAVATHPSTVVALRELHTELRVAGPASRARLGEQSLRGRQALRVSDAVTASLAGSWYDEADLFTAAAVSVVATPSPGPAPLVLYLPAELPGVALDFVRSVATVVDVRIVAQATGDADADADTGALIAALGVERTGPPTHAPPTVRPAAIISTTDADDEVRIAVRHLLDAARDGTPFERMALLWPTQRPYARLVEHHLDRAEVPWNGRPGTEITERLAPRLILDLLDVDRRGLRRRTLFDLLADVPARGADGAFLPTASWERVSREAGVARDDDWERRLRSIAAFERWQEPADSLRTFVTELRRELGHPAATRPWTAWSQWCAIQVERWLGRHSVDRLPEPEYRAWEALTAALDRLGHLDPVGAPVTRHQFRATLEAELDSASPRQGRVGHGVTVGPLASAIGHDVDVTVVLGAAEGLLPPTPASDPLLAEADRLLAGIPTADARTRRLRRQFLTTLATSSVTLTVPRGDLRATAEIRPSRWLTSWTADGTVPVTSVASHHAGLAATRFPACPSEHRLRERYRHHRSGARLAACDSAADDLVLRRGLEMTAHRAADHLTPYDGDLSGVAVPTLDAPVSPSRLEAWIACPHGYFVHYLLGASPIEEPGGEISISARDRGSAQHDALDLLHRAVVTGALPQPTTTGWTDDHRNALRTAFDQVGERNERRGRTGRAAYWADERGRMLADLMTWLDRDSDLVRERGATILASELRFGDDREVAIRLDDGRAVRLRGTIDRVDRAADGSLVVTDHKSGGSRKYKKLTAEDPTLGGTLFQLPSYAAAARAEFGTETTPVRAEYGLMAKGRYERLGYRLTPEVDARVRQALSSILDGIEAGFFPARPERPGFRPFVSCEYCEPDHLGTADRWPDWERKRHDPRLAPWFGVDTTGVGTPAPDGAGGS